VDKKIFSIPVSKLALPVVNFTNVGKVCLGSDLHFTVDQGTITSATDVTFTFANGSHTTAFNSSGFMISQITGTFRIQQVEMSLN
jgi:hypothetical protein